MPRRTKLIMEVADNHGGDMKLAKSFINVAASLGIDYVKFQSWQLARVRDPAKEPFYEWLKNAELSDRMHIELLEECQKRGVKFLTTVFDPERIEFVASLGLDTVKVASPDASNLDLIRRLRERFEHLIISTGMHYPEEIASTAEALRGSSFTLMHCVSIYPHGIEKANLARIEWLRQFSPSVGFSDHSDGIEVAKIAAAMGVDYIERHACLSRYGPGRVNAWDTTPEQWESLVRHIDQIDVAIGSGDVPLGDSEIAARTRFIGRWSGPARLGS